MATVDLDELSAELTAADVSFLDHTYRGGNRRLECFGWVIWTGDENAVWFHNLPPDTAIWTALDIIRRHVAPVAPAPGLREAIAKAIHGYDESIGEVPVDWADNWDGLGNGVKWVYRFRADAVLAVLAERGMR